MFDEQGVRISGFSLIIDIFIDYGGLLYLYLLDKNI